MNEVNYRMSFVCSQGVGQAAGGEEARYRPLIKFPPGLHTDLPSRHRPPPPVVVRVALVLACIYHIPGRAVLMLLLAVESSGTYYVVLVHANTRRTDQPYESY